MVFLFGKSVLKFVIPSLSLRGRGIRFPSHGRKFSGLQAGGLCSNHILQAGSESRFLTAFGMTRIAETRIAESGKDQLHPIRAVQSPVLNRLSNMLALDLRIAFEVRDRSRDFQNTIMRPRAQALLLHGAFQQTFAVAR